MTEQSRGRRRKDWTKEERKIFVVNEGNPERARVVRQGSMFVFLALLVSWITRAFFRDMDPEVWVPILSVGVVFWLLSIVWLVKALRHPHRPADKERSP